MVDRYSNWILVKQSKEGAKGLVSCLRETFATFGITEELASDGGSEFTSNLTKDFLHNWGEFTTDYHLLLFLTQIAEQKSVSNQPSV